MMPSLLVLLLWWLEFGAWLWPIYLCDLLPRWCGGLFSFFRLGAISSSTWDSTIIVVGHLCHHSSSLPLSGDVSCLPWPERAFDLRLWGRIHPLGSFHRGRKSGAHLESFSHHCYDGGLVKAWNFGCGRVKMYHMIFWWLTFSLSSREGAIASLWSWSLIVEAHGDHGLARALGTFRVLNGLCCPAMQPKRGGELSFLKNLSLTNYLWKVFVKSLMNEKKDFKSRLIT